MGHVKMRAVFPRYRRSVYNFKIKGILKTRESVLVLTLRCKGERRLSGTRLLVCSACENSRYMVRDPREISSVQAPVVPYLYVIGDVITNVKFYDKINKFIPRIPQRSFSFIDASDCDSLSFASDHLHALSLGGTRRMNLSGTYINAPCAFARRCGSPRDSFRVARSFSTQIARGTYQLSNYIHRAVPHTYQHYQ